MKIVEKEISLEELKQMSTKMFDSLVKAVVDINLRPNQGNRTRSVDNPQIQQKIVKIVMRLVKP